MMMKDFIIGKVTEVIDGETISLTVDRKSGGNKYAYKERETVKFDKIRLNNISWMTGAFPKPRIEKYFKGKQVLCLIRSLDLFGDFIADVQLIN